MTAPRPPSSDAELPVEGGASDAPAHPKSRARQLGARGALGGFLVFVFVFVGYSTTEIISQAFGLGGVEPLGGQGAAPCTAGLQRLLGALDETAAAARSETTDDLAAQRFRARLEPVWAELPAVEAACAAVPNGTDATATLRRLRAAQEGASRAESQTTGPLRRRLTAYLPR